jgi:GNAT superfamily N-acetyltransferase
MVRRRCHYGARGHNIAMARADLRAAAGRFRQPCGVWRPIRSVRSQMSAVFIRPMEESDLDEASVLFDATLGSGFWDLDLSATGCHVVARAKGLLVGAGSAVVLPALEEVSDLPTPVGLLRLVAVRRDARKTGVGTAVAQALAEGCLDLGAASLAAFAWVHGRSGDCPLGGVLHRLGFMPVRRIEDFYARGRAGEDGSWCPQCGSRPCACSADLYVRSVAHRDRPREQYDA